MCKRIVHMEINDRTCIDIDGLNSGLRGLAIKAEDSCDFEDILNNAIQSFYLAQPGGQRNYNDEESIVGMVRLSRINNEQRPGNVGLFYTPSKQYREKWKYIQRKIGIIDLRGKTYSTEWNEEYEEDYNQIPRVLMRDTEKVMGSLGLTRKSKR